MDGKSYAPNHDLGCGTAAGKPALHTDHRPIGARLRVWDEGESIGSASAPATACAHDKCTEKDALDSACNPCVANICAADPFCCSSSWDWLCVDEVRTRCGNLTCSASTGTCAHTVCSEGPALVGGCDLSSPEPSCVAAICAVDSFCCSGAWDGICVGEVASVCGKSCT